MSKVIIEDGERKGYNLYSISSDEQHNLCSIEVNSSRLKYGRFYFDKKAFAFGSKIIDESNHDNTDLLIIDEIGPLEMNGEGWANSIEKAIEGNLPMVWVVRKHLLQKAAKKWNVECVDIIDLTESEDYEKRLLELVKEIIRC